MSYSKEELIIYRIQRAREALDDAKYLASEDRFNAAANRLYYACFYIISAYLVLKNLKSTTHAGLKSTFNRELVKTGKIKQSEGALFNKLFTMRQQADYEDFNEIEQEDILPLIPRVEQLIEEIRELVDLEAGE